MKPRSIPVGNSLILASRKSYPITPTSSLSKRITINKSQSPQHNKPIKVLVQEIKNIFSKEDIQIAFQEASGLKYRVQLIEKIMEEQKNMEDHNFRMRINKVAPIARQIRSKFKTIIVSNPPNSNSPRVSNVHQYKKLKINRLIDNYKVNEQFNKPKANAHNFPISSEDCSFKEFENESPARVQNKKMNEGLKIMIKAFEKKRFLDKKPFGYSNYPNSGNPLSKSKTENYETPIQKQIFTFQEKLRKEVLDKDLNIKKENKKRLKEFIEKTNVENAKKDFAKQIRKLKEKDQNNQLYLIQSNELNESFYIDKLWRQIDSRRNSEAPRKCVAQKAIEPSQYYFNKKKLKALKTERKVDCKSEVKSPMSPFKRNKMVFLTKEKSLRYITPEAILGKDNSLDEISNQILRRNTRKSAEYQEKKKV